MHTTTAPIRTSSRLLALVLSTLLAASFVVAQQGAANADIAFPNTERIEGSDAISIGVAASQRIFQDDAANVAVLARSDNFPDALAATSVGSTYGGPLLFTPTNRLDTAVRNELARVLEPGDTVFVMGGENAISPAVEDALVAEGYRTERINGATRIETAARATDFVMAELNRQGRTQQTAVLVRSHGNNNDDLIRGWVDAVACGGLAANNDYPILLTNPGTPALHPSTRNRLDIYDFTKVLICGGPTAVPIEHQTEVSTLNNGTTSTVRASGRQRVETAVDVASRNGFWGHNDPTGEVFILVPGWDQDFAYGLAAAQLSDAFNAPLLLVSAAEPRSCEGTDRSAATLCYLGRVGDGRVAGLVAVGSTTVISDATFSSAAEAAGLEEDTSPPAVPEGVAVTDTPQDDGTQVDVAWTAVDDQGQDVSYNVYYKPADETPLTRQSAADVKPTAATSVTIGGLTAGTGYDFAVSSLDAFGNESSLSAVQSKAPTDEAPGKPEAAPSLQQVEAGVKITWSAAPEADAAAYHLQRAVPDTINDCAAGGIPTGASYSNLEDADGNDVVVPIGTTTYTDATVTSGDDFCYRYFVSDTTGQPSDTSPPAGPITVESTPPPPSPPAGTPVILSVNHDSQRGTVDNPTGPTRVPASFRVDVEVPAGAFAPGAQGTVEVFDDGVFAGRRQFVAPTSASAQAYVRSVDITGWASTSILTVVLANGVDAGPPSAGWSVAFVDAASGQNARLSAATIDAVGPVQTDPNLYRDAYPPTVGSGSPNAAMVDPSPIIALGNTPADSDFWVLVFNNGVEAYRECIAIGEITGRVELNESAAADFSLVEGQNNLLVALRDEGHPQGCDVPPDQDPFELSGPLANTQSGDSNTVSYFLKTSDTGISRTVPAAGKTDPFGKTFSVSFNKAVADASFSLRRVQPVEDAGPFHTENAPPGQTTSLLMWEPSPPLASRPGVYEMRVQYTPVGGSRQTPDPIVFTVGNTMALGLNAAVGTNGESITIEPVVEFNGDAPTGFYSASYFDDANCSTGATVVIAAEQFVRGQARRVEASSTAVAKDMPGKTICYQYAEELETANPTQPTLASPTEWQPDGSLPDAVANSSIAVRVVGNGPSFQLVLESGGSWPSGDVYYGPSDLSGGQWSQAGGFDWHRDPVLARSSAGTTFPFPNDMVAIGWHPRYFIGDIYGNKGIPGIAGNQNVASSDGTFAGAQTIQPQNGLGSASGVLSQGDSVLITFAGGAIQAEATGPATSDGGLKLFANQLAVDPKFGSSGGSTAQFSNNVLTVVFGSAARVGGQPTPAAVSPPTRLHGGAGVGALPWANYVNTGHSVLLPPPATEVRNGVATW